MPRRPKNRTKAPPGRAKKTKVRGKPRARRAKIGQVAKAMSSYAQLVADPCYGPLVRSVGGTTGAGVVQRIRSTYTNVAANGYIVWFPSYSCGSQSVANYYPYNAYVFEDAASSTVVTNSVAVPMGRGTTGGNFLSDPCCKLIDSGSSPTAFSRAKTLAACMNVEYSGSMSAAAGLIAKVANMSVTSFMPQKPGSTPSVPMTIDQMFAYANKRGRLDIAGEELKWYPTETGSVMRTPAIEGATNAVINGTTLEDTVWWSGVAGTSATTVTCEDSNTNNAIVIAWKGAVVGTLNINLTKVVELELNAFSNTIEEPKGPVNTAKSGGVAAVTEFLDKVNPSWQTDVMNTGMRMASGMAASAVNSFTMPLQFASTRGLAMLRDM